METGQLKVVEKAKVPPPTTQAIVEATAEARAGKVYSRQRERRADKGPRES